MYPLRAKAQVRWLVMGSAGSVCSDCIAASARILGDKLGDASQAYRTVGTTRSLQVSPGDQSEQTAVTIELEPRIAAIFPDSDAVNSTLRPLAELITVEAVRRGAKQAEKPEPTTPEQGT